ncbi:MAG TPA: hypothetical protein ENH55_18095 [Aurantimonas coralicida]|uniref:Uncharacterized protein n=2 Tax=root TaxID=1 RepID=A0A9C9NF25_9HYPH|nr:hypothetical protein [Aurantimonas coralicida]HEU00441.1 hypothetical protein [Aurantimonas coralicida]
MTAVLRFLFVIPFGFVAACMTAAFAMLWPFLTIPAGMGASDPIFLFHTVIAFLAQSAQIGSVILLPWALFMVASELFGLSSILLHLAAGLIGAGAILVTAYGDNLPNASVQTAIVVAALSFTLIYWIVAGRSAGRWRRGSGRTTPAAEPTIKG